LPFAVEADDFIAKAGKIIRKEFAVNVVQENNTRRKREAGVSEVEDHVFLVPYQKSLKGDHLPKQMGFYAFFMPDNVQVFVWRDIGGIGGNYNGNFTGGY
jgi:hypothetical protein